MTNDPPPLVLHRLIRERVEAIGLPSAVGVCRADCGHVCVIAERVRAIAAAPGCGPTVCDVCVLVGRAATDRSARCYRILAKLLGEVGRDVRREVEHTLQAQVWS